MPARNRVKTYIPNACYHTYNRGVEKRKIFLDDQDYQVFLHLLKRYLSTPPSVPSHPLSEVTDFRPKRFRPHPTYHDKAQLLAFCLLPNHFHLLLFQSPKDGIRWLMQSLLTTYVMYFNRKYARVGPLFQDIYKAAWVGEGSAGDTYLLHLSRYIHLNPKFELTGTSPVTWAYSSYPYYLGRKWAAWVHPEKVLVYFSQGDEMSVARVSALYRRFVDVKEDPRDQVGHLAIE